MDFFASERLFLINPAMDGTASAGTGLRGERSGRKSLVEDHVSVLPDVTVDVTVESSYLVMSYFMVTFAL